MIPPAAHLFNHDAAIEEGPRNSQVSTFVFQRLKTRPVAAPRVCTHANSEVVAERKNATIGRTVETEPPISTDLGDLCIEEAHHDGGPLVGKNSFVADLLRKLNSFEGVAREPLRIQRLRPLVEERLKHQNVVVFFDWLLRKSDQVSH